MRARLLLDSELVLWALAAPARLSREVRALLDASEVYVSAASILEIGQKSATGPVAAEVLAALEPSGLLPLAVTAEHAALAMGLPGAWPDSFDRLLVAQASAEGMTLLTSDAALAAVPAPSAPPGRAGRGRTAATGGRRARARARARARGGGGGGGQRPRAVPPPARCRIVVATETPSKRRRRP